MQWFNLYGTIQLSIQIWLWHACFTHNTFFGHIELMDKHHKIHHFKCHVLRWIADPALIKNKYGVKIKKMFNQLGIKFVNPNFSTNKPTLTRSMQVQLTCPNTNIFPVGLGVTQTRNRRENGASAARFVSYNLAQILYELWNYY